MRAFVPFRFAALALFSLSALLALPGGAFAAKPTFVDKIDFTIPDAEICGFIGTAHVTGVQVITLIGDTDFTVTGQVTTVFTTADGKTATLMGTGKVVGTVTDNGDGTITFTTTFTGLPEKIGSRGSGGTALRDAGVITFIMTFDTNTGELISDEVIIKGPHPEAESDFTLFCEAFAEALA
jgi:hypothetical protein